MFFIDKVIDKLHRNSKIYAEAYRHGKIVGFDYTLLMWKNHTKFLLRLSKPEDKKKEIQRQIKFWDTFTDVITPYKYNSIYSEGPNNEEIIIWIYWNDISTMPQMVASCIEQIRKNSNGHKVVVVTEDSVTDFIQLDDVIWQKYREGKISRTHFCDIVRIALLYQYGGVWMDCTLLLTHPLPDYVTSSDFYTNHLDKWDDNNVGGGRWSTFFWSCHKGNLLMQTTLDVFIEYWHRYDYIADYVWMDYIFNMIYNHIPSVKAMIDAVPVNNPDIWIMQTQISKPFSQEEYNTLLSDKSRFLYKFSYKDSINVPLRDSKGNITLKGRLCGEK